MLVDYLFSQQATLIFNTQKLTGVFIECVIYLHANPLLGVVVVEVDAPDEQPRAPEEPDPQPHLQNGIIELFGSFRVVILILVIIRKSFLRHPLDVEALSLAGAQISDPVH